MTQPLGQFAAGAASGPAFALEEGAHMLRVRLHAHRLIGRQHQRAAC
ncbi:MAG: hypothetical protein ACXV5Q_16970 [Frankiaceae bacterium]